MITEPSSKKGIFVGYSDYSKAYRVYIPGQRYIEVNRDVIFHEEAMFRKTLGLSPKDAVAPLEFPDRLIFSGSFPQVDIFEQFSAG